MLMPDGSYKWLETTFHNQLHEPAVGAIVLNFRDITESKIAEIALRTREARFNQAQRIGQMGSWEMDLADSSVKWSDEIYHMLGVEKGKIEPSIEAFVSFIHPDDVEEALSHTERVLKSPEDGVNGFRILRPGGQLRHVVSEWRIEVDGDGKSVSSFGILKDVTEGKIERTGT